jgi:hypothetical protein
MAYKYDSLRTTNISSGAGVDLVLNTDSDIFFDANGSGNIPFNSTGQSTLISTNPSIVGAINEMELTTDTYFVSTTAELNAAITAIATSGNLSLINIAPVALNINTSVVLSNVFIRGSGRGTRLGFSIGGPFTWTLGGNVHISNCTLTSTASILTVNNTSGNEMSNCEIVLSNGICLTLACGNNLFKINNCNFGGLTGATHGIFEDKTTFGTLECQNCSFLNIATAGIEISGFKAVKLLGCSFTGTIVGLRFLTPAGTLGTASTLVEGCSFDTCTIAVEFDTAGRTYRNKNITGCSFGANGTHISNDTLLTECKVSGNTFTTKGSTTDFNNAVGGTQLNISNNEYFLSIADGSTTLSGLESYVNCVNSAVGITVNLPTLPRASAGHTIVINKANATSTVTIGGSVNDFTDFSWSADGHREFTWTGQLWRRGNGFAEEYIECVFNGDEDITHNNLTTLDTWTFSSGQADWLSGGQTITIPLDGVYMVQCSITWESNATGGRTISLRLNGSQYLEETRTAAPTSVGRTHQFVCGMARFSSGDAITIVVVQTSTVTLHIDGTGSTTTKFNVARIS